MRSITSICLLLCACGPSGPEWLRVELATSRALHAIWGTSPNDVYAVGEAGTLLHYNGTAWRALESGGAASLYGVWASSPSDVWISSERGVLRGSQAQGFAPVPGAPSGVNLLWGTGPNDVWLAANAALYRYDGQAFQEVVSRTGSGWSSLRATSFSGNPNIGQWMVANGSLYRRVPDGWQKVDVGTSGDWRLVLAGTANDVWLFGQYGKTLRFDGRTWTVVESKLLDAIGSTLAAGWANGPNDLWLVGERGRIVHFDGRELKLEAEGTYGAPTLTSVWGTADDMYAVGSGGWMLRRYVTR